MATTQGPLTKTLSHLPPEVQEMVRAVARAVVEGAPVEMLILFGSFARGTFQDDRETGYKSDLDLLAVADDEKTANDVGLWNAAAERAQERAGEVRVDLIVHDRRYLNDQIRLGSYFFVECVVKSQGETDDLKMSSRVRVGPERKGAVNVAGGWTGDLQEPNGLNCPRRCIAS